MEMYFSNYGLSDSDIITLFIGIVTIFVLSITAIVLYQTLVSIKASNEENAKLNRIQSAENTIMKQIEFHYNMLNRMKVVKYHEYNQKELEDWGLAYTGAKPWWEEEGIGQNAFKILYQELNKYYKGEIAEYKDAVDKISKREDVVKRITEKGKIEGRIYSSFSVLYDKYGSEFGNYYKNLYYLVKYIDKLSKRKEYEKEHEKIEYYGDLIKAQLSKYEILLLAYDCIWIQDMPEGENFIEYARDHDILIALETKDLIDPQSHMDLLKNRYKIKFRKTNEARTQTSK